MFAQISITVYSWSLADEKKGERFKSTVLMQDNNELESLNALMSSLSD